MWLTLSSLCSCKTLLRQTKTKRVGRRWRWGGDEKVRKSEWELESFEKLPAIPGENIITFLRRFEWLMKYGITLRFGLRFTRPYNSRSITQHQHLFSLLFFIVIPTKYEETFQVFRRKLQNITKEKKKLKSLRNKKEEKKKEEKESFTKDKFRCL